MEPKAHYTHIANALVLYLTSSSPNYARYLMTSQLLEKLEDQRGVVEC